MCDEGSGVKCLGLSLSLWVFTGRAHSLLLCPNSACVCVCGERVYLRAVCICKLRTLLCFIRLVCYDQTVNVGRHTLMYTHIILPDKKATFSLRMGSTSIALISSFLLKPAQREREEEKNNEFLNGRIKKNIFSHSISRDFLFFFFFT